MVRQSLLDIVKQRFPNSIPPPFPPPPITNQYSSPLPIQFFLEKYPESIPPPPQTKKIYPLMLMMMMN